MYPEFPRKPWLMKTSPPQIALSLAALLSAMAIMVFVSQNPARIGNEPLVIRALILSIAIIGGLIAVYPLSPFFKGRPGAYGLIAGIAVLIPVFVWFLYLLPNQAGTGMVAEQLRSDLITDSSSNAIIEIGFPYPIYTPTIAITNRELFTREVDVFLRISDADGDSSLFRAVRAVIPGSGLSVEASVQSMLSESRGYLFNPLTLPPQRTMSGRVVFVINNAEDGADFTGTLARAHQAQFELREPQDGGLLLVFPLDRI